MKETKVEYYYTHYTMIMERHVFKNQDAADKHITENSKNGFWTKLNTELESK